MLHRRFNFGPPTALPNASSTQALSTYRLRAPYERPPLRRRGFGLVLAVAANLGLLLLLLTLDRFSPDARKISHALVVDLVPESHSLSVQSRNEPEKAAATSRAKPLPKPPPLVIPAKPTIAVPPPQPPAKAAPWVELSQSEMSAGDLRNLPKPSAGGGGDSAVVGKGPHGEVLYAAEWARHPTDAELGGYLPANAPDGYGLIACRTIPGDRVDDCVELDQEPHGSHLASAVRQAAWQFRIRPPRKNGVPLVGEWVEIRIDYERVERDAKD
jgi:protein TonB